MLLASCATSSTTSAPTSNTTTNVTSTATIPTPSFTPTTTPQPTFTPTVTATTTSAGNWWDKLGTPQYGGTMTIQWTVLNSICDPYNNPSNSPIYTFLETFFQDKWTEDPSIFAYQFSFRPSDYLTGRLVASYEFTDPTTFVIHLRQGIHWQNIAPANGREFTSDDVIYHYDRMMGIGDGFTQPSPFQASNLAAFSALSSITAPDKYTVIFKWKPSNVEFITETLQAYGSILWIECPDVVKQYGNTADWHHAIGTGPFILTDLVDASSVTLVRNPNYWGYDERHPQNQLPYVDTLKVLIIPVQATALAALRTGKIDDTVGLTSLQVQSMLATNPYLLTASSLASQAVTVNPRVDKAPFTDIRVRQAMQEAVDLPTIAKTYYNGTVSPDPSSLMSNYMTGWGFPYSQWPQSLKDLYAYNPTNAKALLAAAGYPNGFKTTCIDDTGADQDLLQIVKSYFAAIGIDMSIQPMDSNTFTTFVQQGHHQDALAYRNGGSLGSGVDFFRLLSGFMTGYGNNYSMIADPTYDAFYAKAMATTNTDQMKQVMTAASQYASQQFWFVCLLQASTYTAYEPWLKGGFNGQAMALTNAGIMSGFYCARLWIDQNMKKSMGF